MVKRVKKNKRLYKKINKKTDKYLKNLKEQEQKLLNIATSKQAVEQLNGVEQRMLYNAVYVLNKMRLGD